MIDMRQYIGARYVIKIYENSQDPSSAEWEQGNYEPLIMVTWQNGSYLSKKEVPATVGNPANNPNYWVQTGFYNGQIANLQSQIDAINNTIQTLTNNVGDLTALETTDKTSVVAAINSILNGEDKYYLFLSDSYNGHPTVGTWGGSTATYLGLDEDHYYYFGVSGADFTNGGMLTSAQNGIAASSVDINLISDVVIGCGANEMLDYTSASAIESAIDTVYNYIKANVPNVKRIFLAFIGNDRQRVTANNINDGIEMNIINAYRHCEAYEDFKFIPNVQYVLKNYAYLENSDLLHPNATGYDKIGLATAKYLQGYDNSIDEYQPLSGSWVNVSGIANITDRRCYISRHNEMTVINFDLLHCSCTWNASNGNPLTIKTMPLGLVMPTVAGGEVVLGQCAMELYDGTNWHDADCSIALVINSTTAPYRAQLVIKYNSDNALSGVTQFKIYNKKVVVPTTIC